MIAADRVQSATQMLTLLTNFYILILFYRNDNYSIESVLYTSILHYHPMGLLPDT